MNVFLRKLRGVVATGLIWCPAWAALFAVLVSMLAIFLPFRGDVGPMRMIAIVGWVGFVSGGLFGILMSFGESGRTPSHSGISIDMSSQCNILSPLNRGVSMVGLQLLPSYG